MGKKFGKRKTSPGMPEEDLRDLFGSSGLPRHAIRPASSTPLADQLNHGWPGVDAGYVVLPRSIAEGMSLPWQQQMAALLAEFHQQHARLDWPVYRVVPSRYENLVDLDEEQLAEAGYLVEIDTEGELVYRERSGRKVEDPASTTVLVSCLDPIPKPARRAAPQAARAAQPENRPSAAEPPRAPAPMNIGPAPVWRTVAPQAQPPAPPLPVPTSAPVAAPPPAAQTPPVVPPPPPIAPPPVSGELVAPPDSPAPMPLAATPPRGTAMGRDWFDEMTPEPPESSKVDPPAGDEFGPTGDPTEIPYRYRR